MKRAARELSDAATMARQINQTRGLEFLLAEIDTGLTLARIAAGARKPEGAKFERNRQNARRAYSSAMRFGRRVSMDSSQKAQFEKGMKQLEKALEALDRPAQQ